MLRGEPGPASAVGRQDRPQGIPPLNELLTGGRTIVVTVAGPDNTVITADVLARLADSLVGHGDPLARVQVVAHRPARGNGNGR